MALVRISKDLSEYRSKENKEKLNELEMLLSRARKIKSNLNSLANDVLEDRTPILNAAIQLDPMIERLAETVKIKRNKQKGIINHEQ